MGIKHKIEELHASLPQGVKLVAVSKFHPIEALSEAYGAGQRIFGESRVQELLIKQEALPKDIEWQMIGHLQTNKVRQIVPFVSLIQSVDSVRLVECINREAERIGRVVDILLEIHVAQEESKTGWRYDELLNIWRVEPSRRCKTSACEALWVWLPTPKMRQSSATTSSD